VILEKSQLFFFRSFDANHELKHSTPIDSQVL